MTQPDGTQGPKNDLGDELRELGQQLEQMVRSTLQSERAQEIQRDIANGLREVSTQMQSALKSIGESPQVQQLAERGQKAIEQAQDSQVVKEFQEALARGIAQLNEQLAAFANRSTTPPPSTGATNISIDPEPSTGETTRLDS